MVTSGLILTPFLILQEVLHCLALNAAPFERQPASLGSKWTRIGPAETTSMLDLKIVMSNPKDEYLEHLALKIATPHSGMYRKHLTPHELANWTNIPEHRLEKVEQWLSSCGIDATRRKHDILEARVSIVQAQKLLNTSYHAYADNLGRVVHRAEEYYIPGDLTPLIEFVHPTVNFPHRRARLERGQNLFSDGEVSPFDHEMSNLQGRATANPRLLRTFEHHVTLVNTLADGVRVNATDVQKYLELFNPPAAKAHAQIANHRIGPIIHQVEILNISEELLDAQQLIGNGFPVKASYTFLNGKPGDYQWGPQPDQKKLPPHLHHYEEYYIDFLHSLAHADFVPAALTSSEFDYDLTVTHKYAQYMCKLWSQLGARGVSVFFCSADQGSGGLRTNHGARVLPIFTSGCPFVTSVGSTVYVNGTELAVTPQTWTYIYDKELEFISGGGFSSIFPRPKYQEATAGAYVAKENLAAKLANVSMFNANGRGYPDVAAFGTNLPYVNNAELSYVGGTSASTPTVAALIGILNAYEESKGRPPLGFLNPWFYSNLGMFNDITAEGSNELCTKKKCRGLGYPVTNGWDAVTGLGSLKFDKLRQALDQMAAEGALG